MDAVGGVESNKVDRHEMNAADLSQMDIVILSEETAINSYVTNVID